MVSIETQTDRKRMKSATFHIGEQSSDESSEDSDVDVSSGDSDVVTSSVETQTEGQQQLVDYVQSRPPRPLQECAAILKSVVSIEPF
jgi:hypothetical protein